MKLYEADEALKKKADKSGISYGTLKKVIIVVLPHGRLVIGQALPLNSGDMPVLMPSNVKKKKGGLNHDKDLA